MGRQEQRDLLWRTSLLAKLDLGVLVFGDSEIEWNDFQFDAEFFG